MNFDYRVSKTEQKGKKIIYTLVGGHQVWVMVDDDAVLMIDIDEYVIPMTDNQKVYFLQKAHEYIKNNITF